MTNHCLLFCKVLFTYWLYCVHCTVYWMQWVLRTNYSLSDHILMHTETDRLKNVGLEQLRFCMIAHKVMLYEQNEWELDSIKKIWTFRKELVLFWFLNWKHFLPKYRNSYQYFINTWNCNEFRSEVHQPSRRFLLYVWMPYISDTKL